MTRRRELLWVSGTVLLILLPNLVTAARSPTVWMDEVMLAEPAANLLLGRGLVSNAWPRFAPSRAWAGNAPLHTWLLAPWIAVWGLTPTAVRAINFLYIGVAALLLWAAVRSFELIRAPVLRIALVALVLCENAVVFSYRGGRYDTLGVLLVAMAAAAAAVKTPALRTALLVLIGIPVPFAGLQLVPYAAVVFLALLLVFGPRTLRATVPSGAGIAAGGALLYAVFRALGTWDAFVLAVRGQRTGAEAGAGMVLGADPTLLLAIAALLIGVKTWRRFDVLALVLVAAVPIVVGLSGRFPRYYLWMIAIPAVVAATGVWERLPSRRAGLAVAALLIFGAMAGLPARLAVTAIEWRQRDYAPVEDLVARGIKPGDVVYADWQAFYGIVHTGARVYYPAYSLAPEEKASLTRLMISPDDFGSVSQALGGRWREMDCLRSAPYGLGAKLYSLCVYARE